MVSSLPDSPVAVDPMLHHAARTAALALRASLGAVKLRQDVHCWRSGGIRVGQLPTPVSLAEHAPVIVPDTTRDRRFAAMPMIGFFAGTPIRGPDGATWGALAVQDIRPRSFGLAERRLLHDLAHMLSEQIALRVLAETDPLTGADNQRHHLVRAEAHGSAARSHHLPLSMLLIDLDRFKSINDRHGHAVGDAVLKRVVALCRETLRAEDSIGRVGGEEFAVLLPATTATGALAAAERIRQRISNTDFGIGAVAIPVSASIGVATLRGPTEPVTEVMARADRALYRAKRSGRNRVVNAEEVPSVLRRTG